MKIKNIIVENYNHEYDDEAGMAETNLVTIARAAKGLLDTIEDHENLPEWVQEKIAKVEGMMVTAWNYLESQEAQGVSEAQQLNVQQLATISDAALDKAYGYGRSQPGNSFGWQANLKSAAFAKQMIDKGVTDIEAISDAIHKGWNTTAQAFVQNPEQFDDTAKLKAAGKLEAKLQQRAQLMKQNYGQLPEEEKEKDRVVARALLQALKGEQGMAEGWKEKVAAATIAGSMALGAAGAGATGLPGGSSSVDQSAGKPVATQVAPTDAGFINRVQAQHRAMEQMNPQYAKDHAGLNIAMVRGIGGGSDVKNQQWAQKTAQLLQKYGAQVKEDIAIGRVPDPQNYDSDWDYYNDRDADPIPDDQETEYDIEPPDQESDPIPNDAPYESREKVGNMDADAFDDAISRLKKLAGQGPLRTVYDPARRVYRNVPTAQQPAKQPQK
jgi:hypothetical protein